MRTSCRPSAARTSRSRAAEGREDGGALVPLPRSVKAGYRFGTARTFQPGAGPPSSSQTMRGSSASLPGQNGQWGSRAGRCSTRGPGESKGRSARPGATADHRPVTRFLLNSPRRSSGAWDGRLFVTPPTCRCPANPATGRGLAFRERVDHRARVTPAIACVHRSIREVTPAVTPAMSGTAKRVGESTLTGDRGPIIVARANSHVSAGRDLMRVRSLRLDEFRPGLGGRVSCDLAFAFRGFAGPLFTPSVLHGVRP
jgi:hypothetical protein